jgi:FixJ family two-component response regulator
MSIPATNIYIAVVDDDESVCRSLGRLLRAAGIQPVTYPTAEAFLADTKHPRFDCLVLDIQLGGMSGIELQRHLAASGDRTPVIFITAHDAPEAREEALAAGCAAYFRKTDSGADVLEAIRRLAA